MTVSDVLDPSESCAPIVPSDYPSTRELPLGMPNSRSGLRKGSAAIPMYLIAVGAAHVWLAMLLYDRTTGLARDGQAFSGTLVVGVLFVIFGVLVLPVALVLERDRVGLARDAVVALIVAAAVTAYTAANTAIQGFVVGGTAGQVQCVVEQGRELCPPGDGTWIADARPDVFVMLVAVFAAYLLAHVIARQGRYIATLVRTRA